MASMASFDRTKGGRSLSLSHLGSVLVAAVYLQVVLPSCVPVVVFLRRDPGSSPF